MTTDKWVGGTGTQQFGTEGASDANWSTGKVPGSSDDADIDNSSATTVEVTSNEDVNSIALGSNDTLSFNTINFLVQDGTGLNINAGVIDLGSDGFLVLYGGTFDSTGSIEMSGSATHPAAIFFNDNTDLEGSGIIAMQGSSFLDNHIGGDVPGQNPVVASSEDISGSGIIGESLIFDNNGTVETGNGQLEIDGTSDGGGFFNNATVRADNGGQLLFGDINPTTVYNNEIIELDSTGNPTELQILGNVTIVPSAINGNNIIALTGSDPEDDEIVSKGGPAALTVSNETLKGAGTVGDSNLTLTIASGSVVDADSSGAILALNTGSNTIDNQGTMEATNGADLSIESFVDSTGTIQALGGVVDDSTIIEGSVNIGTGGTFIIEAASGVDGDVMFTGTGARLILDSSGGGISGSIAGGVLGDQIVLGSVAYASSMQAVWNQTNSAGGTLSVIDGGSTVYTLDLAGQYTNGEFSVQDLNGFVEIALPNPNPPSGTTADMIMRDGSNGNYEIYDLGSNTILTAGYLGQVGTTWQVAGVGGFFGADTSDMILRNSGTGAFEVYDISNNAITFATSMGQVGLEWSVAGFGDFSSRAGETDMLMRNSNTGAFEIYDISNNTITSAAPMGQVGLEWSIAGFGDFSGNADETDMLMRNTNTGAFEIYDISNNQLTSAGPMGQVGLEWSVAGFGDFSGNADETDMLMRNSNTGAFEIYDISNNQLTSAGPMGQVGLEWSVAGFGPIDGAGSSDMLMRNTNTGAFEVYDISNSQLTNAASMGQVGNAWAVGGIAADPPGGSAPSQMAQTMAGYAPASGALDTGSPLGLTTMQATTASPFAASLGQVRQV
jgi:hypothetical protein